MRSFLTYLKEYFIQIHRRQAIFTTLFVLILIVLNFTVGIEKRIYTLHFPLSLIIFFAFYSFVFGISYWFAFAQSGAAAVRNKKLFFAYFFIAVLSFSLKQVPWQIPFSSDWNYPWGRYWTTVLQLPLKLLMTIALLAILWRKNNTGGSFFGLSLKNFKPGPYLVILIFLVPLVALASTRPDFLHAYPKMKNIYFINGYTDSAWVWKLLYEISYGLDFVSIELFFRGFLVIGFIRFAGVNAIMPMAAFYCSIHFGKPLGECVSSYFGGLALGVIAYRTRSIVGGLLVHLGLAWMMELFGYFTSLFFI